MVLYIAIGIAGMLLLAVGVILFVVKYQRRVFRHQLDIRRMEEAREKDLIQAAFRAGEAERMRIAAELHDNVGATLSTVRMFLYQAGKRPGDQQVLDDSVGLLNEGITTVRNLSHSLHSSALQELGLDAALSGFAGLISRSGSMQMSYSAQSALPRLPEYDELSVYRIVQELTANIVKHAGANKITVTAASVSDQLIIRMTHDGIGLSQEAFLQLVNKRDAIGLKNIVSRLKSINSTITFSCSDKNSVITLIRPLS